MEVNNALWRLRQAHLPLDLCMTRTLLPLDLDTHSFTRQRPEHGGMPGTQAAIAQEDGA